MGTGSARVGGGPGVVRLLKYLGVRVRRAGSQGELAAAGHQVEWPTFLFLACFPSLPSPTCLLLESCIFLFGFKTALK